VQKEVRVMKNILNTLKELLGLNPRRRRNEHIAAMPALERLEERRVMSVNAVWMSGSTLVARTDNQSTTVELRQSGDQIQILDTTTNRTWNYTATTVGQFEFQGGDGNDRFVNNVRSLPVRAFGGNGNDYLEGYDGADVLVGGNGNDTLVGYGGNDQLWGGDGDDTLRGGFGNDRLYGDSGNDHLNGDAGNDLIWGGDGDDTLLGGTGDDDLMGGVGNDHLNGQEGLDRLWGDYGNDVLIAIDNGTSDYLQSDSGSDTLWVDRNGSSTDLMYGNSSADLVNIVASFANSADRTLNGDRIADPNSGSNPVRSFSGPLFSSNGPRVGDVKQGSLGDCYFLAGLGAIAIDSPNVIRQRIVDFNIELLEQFRSRNCWLLG